VALPIHASAAQVSDALSALINCGPVRVTRSDFSSQPNGTLAGAYDGSGVGTSLFKLEWRVTFLGNRERRSLPLLTATRVGVVSAGRMDVFGVQSGRGLANQQLSIAPALAAPSVPRDVNVTVISTSELGVYWRKPLHAGGSPVTKYLVEWDKTTAQSRSVATHGRTYREAMAFSEVVTGTKYQIRHLEEGQPYWVRVSAFSGGAAGEAVSNASKSFGVGALGYGVPRRTNPHFAVPAPQVPYKPTNVTFRLSTTGFVDARLSPGEWSPPPPNRGRWWIT